MRVLFVGVGLTDYINQLLNKLDKEAALEIYNLIDANGVGHIPSGTHQSREGILYKIVSLPGVVKNKYNNNSYWSFVNLAKTLSDIRPDIIITTPRYIHTFLYDKQIASKIKEIRTKLILRDNPFLLERYDKRKEKILAGKIDDQYIPFYVFYFVRLLQLLGFKNSEVITQKTMQMLRLTRLCSRARSRGVLLARLEEKKHILNVVDANASYIEEAYELYGSYGVPREKIFILYNSPDTDILFAIREKIEHEPPILRYNPHRIIHVGRLVTQKRVDMLIDAVAEFQKDFSDTELLVVGYGPEDSALRALARESGVEGRVRFVGGVYDQACWENTF
jgi:glycosyltransferase involved in cell wall biosynthesis